MLKPYYREGTVEAGCDEAGRGCLAGPVYAAAVVFAPDYRNEMLNDSKQLSEKRRYLLRDAIERDALAWAVGIVDNKEIDRINILRASILAMHRALDSLALRPDSIIVDGNRWQPYRDPSTGDTVQTDTIVKGDGKYLSIAAASILAKTYRDDFMKRIHEEYPGYGWDHNKGYPSAAHREALRLYGPTPYHRMTFNLYGTAQLEFDFGE